MTRTSLHAPRDQPVSFVELFFDLVFVFAVTQVTALTAHHLDPAGIARSALLFWLIWWAWTQFTWTLNPADTTHPLVRALTLLATAAAFVMAASVGGAFGDRAMWFVVPYVVIRSLGIGLQVCIALEQAGERTVSMVWVHVSLVGLALVIAGGMVDPPARNWLWLSAVGIDVVAGLLGGGRADWHLNPAHVTERHGLFVIIAIGESMVVAGTAVAELERTVELGLAAAAALAVVCLLWWTYFGWLKDAMEHAFAGAAGRDVGRLTRDAYSFGHFPLICGIIGFAVAVEEILLHPDTPASGAVVASLAVGIALFVGASTFAYWRTVGRLLTLRVAVLAATILAVVVVAGADPVWTLVAVAAGLLVIVVGEGAGGRHR